jgi:hypothetical protein
MSFSPHLAQIQIERREPDQFNIDETTREIRKRNAQLAERIVVEGWLKRPKPKAKANKKLKRVIEFEERLKLTGDFMEIWNHWRHFYFELPAMKIKTPGQITGIENIAKLVEDEGLNLNMLIATTHKAFVWRKVNPNFNQVVFNGLEFYDRFYDEVQKDVDRQEYIEDSLE